MKHTSEQIGPCREQLAWLGDHQPALITLFDAAGAQGGWWELGCDWSRSFARFDPLGSPYCTLLYESQGEHQYLCLVEAYSQPIALHSEHEIGIACAPLGWVKLTRFPHDPALLTLPEVLKEAAQVKVVRYRPHLRCTLRVGADRGEAGSFVKVFPDAYGAAIHETGVLLWNAHTRGELGFHVAQPRRWDAAKLCLWQGQAPGEPAEPQLLGEQGAVVAHRLGRALATLANSSVALPEKFDAGWQFARTQAYLRDLAVSVPQAATSLDALAAALEIIHAALAPGQLRPLHGAPHPQQWLAGEQGYSLVDFDRAGRGDVELDVAAFVAEVDFLNAKRYDVARINEGFVCGFESVAGALDPMRFGLYRAHKHVAKALRLARSVRVDGTVKAAALLDHVRDNLGPMCAATTARRWALDSAWKGR